MQLRCCESSGDAPSPQGGSDAFVAFFHRVRGLGFRQPGDEGVASTFLRRGVAATRSPPAPARKAMLVRSGLSGNGCAQFQMHAPQWTHFSRSNTGTPPSPGAMAWPEQILGE
jgi:hypothetical protein